MGSIAVRVEDLGKQYRIGRVQPKYGTLRDSIAAVVSAPFRGWRGEPGSRAGDEDTIWALHGVSFEVQQGELVGIIGRNGAGKSTLLKILSRITEPTTGMLELRGRMGSLLEVGTGFHAELTGRENIYLNGSILGMRRAEISARFDEIVAFAEVDRFIDTPVKHYSSGMYLRLAFSVAAHLEPEILVVDEVLAVGDAAFQRKCLNKMEDVGRQGRTVFFVSHSMPAITRLCARAILLHDGALARDGTAHEVAGAYLNSGLGTTAAREWTDAARMPGSDAVRLQAVRVRTEDGPVASAFDIRQSLVLEMEYEVRRDGLVLLPNFNLVNQDGVAVFTTLDLDPAWRRRPRPTGCWTSRVTIPGNLLSEGTIYVEPALLSLDPFIGHFRERDAIAFQVVDSLDGDSARGDWVGEMGGAVRPLLQWSTDREAPRSLVGAIRG
jgi:homopolymeric O-antigen transport system ATP-binding protein